MPLYTNKNVCIQAEFSKYDFKNRYNVSRLQLPLEGCKKEKDISDYFAIGNTKEDFIKLINEQRT